MFHCFVTIQEVIIGILLRVSPSCYFTLLLAKIFNKSGSWGGQPHSKLGTLLEKPWMVPCQCWVICVYSHVRTLHISSEGEAFERGFKIFEEPGAANNNPSATDVGLHPLFILQSGTTSLLDDVSIIIAIHHDQLFLHLPEHELLNINGCIMLTCALRCLVQLICLHYCFLRVTDLIRLLLNICEGDLNCLSKMQKHF